MEYLIPGVLVLLLIAGFVTFFVFNAMKKSGPVAEKGDEGAPGMGGDETPLGDTTQHAGQQTDEGRTVGNQDADASGGTGRPVHSGTAGTTGAGYDASDPDAAAHVARPGEGEGHAALDFQGHPPARADAAPPAGGVAASSAEGQAPASTPEPEPEPQAGSADEDDRPASERLADRGV